MPLLANLRPDKLCKGDLCLLWTGLKSVYMAPLCLEERDQPLQVCLTLGSFQHAEEFTLGVAGTYHLHFGWFYRYDQGRWGPLTERWTTFDNEFTLMARRFYHTTEHGELCHGGAVRGELDCTDRYAMTQFVKQCLPILDPVLEDYVHQCWALGEDPARFRW